MQETNGVESTTNGDPGVSTPSKEKQQPFNLLNRIGDNLDLTPRSSIAGSPAPENASTPQPGGDATTNTGNAFSNQNAEQAFVREDPLPILALDQAILTSITHAARGDERKTRDFLGGIMLTGGGSLTPGLHVFLEERLRELRPGFTKEIMISTPPRELDAQVVTWKGGSVYGKLSQTNDTWIGQIEWDRLGSRVLAYKTIWAW
jgi:actin-related protein 8